jgi:hypothetical protein
MKTAAEWNEEDLLNLPQGEHDWLEFKSSKLLDLNLTGVNQSSVLDELSKQLSAFANSGGGTIVYGIQDTPIGVPRTIDPDGGVSVSVKNGTKEWLEDVIPNLVEFPLMSFNVYVITRSSAASGIAAGKGIFLVDVADSESAPHQASDKKYYARVGGKSRPIGHRLVTDIFGRTKYPKFEMLCSVVPKEKRSEHENRDAVRFFCRNSGKVFANYVNGFIYVPIDIYQGSPDQSLSINDKYYSRIWFDNTDKDVVGYGNAGQYGYRRPLTITRYDPVLPGLGFRAAMLDLAIAKEELPNFAAVPISWEIYADNAPIETGLVTIGDLTPE